MSHITLFRIDFDYNIRVEKHVLLWLAFQQRWAFRNRWFTLGHSDLKFNIFGLCASQTHIYNIRDASISSADFRVFQKLCVFVLSTSIVGENIMAFYYSECIHIHKITCARVINVFFLWINACFTANCSPPWYLQVDIQYIHTHTYIYVNISYYSFTFILYTYKYASVVKIPYKLWLYISTYMNV